MYPIKFYLLKLSIILLVLFQPALVLAQDDDEDEEELMPPPSLVKRQANTEKVDDKKIKVGGTLGFSFGTYTYIDISPIVGYALTERWRAGIGFTYRYVKGVFPDPYSGINYNIEISVYGGRLFTTYQLFETILLHVEFEDLNYKVPVNYNVYERRFIPAFFVGGGAIQKLGGNVAIHFILLYDIIQHPYSPYLGNIVFRSGIVVGI